MAVASATAATTEVASIVTATKPASIAVTATAAAATAASAGAETAAAAMTPIAHSRMSHQTSSIPFSDELIFFFFNSHMHELKISYFEAVSMKQQHLNNI